MLWIDTHTHFYDTAFDEDRDQAVQRALAQGLRYFLQPSVSMQEYQPMMDFCAKYPEALPMVGLHPCAVGEDYQKQLDFFAQELPKHNSVARKCALCDSPSRHSCYVIADGLAASMLANQRLRQAACN